MQSRHLGTSISSGWTSVKCIAKAFLSINIPHQMHCRLSGAVMLTSITAKSCKKCWCYKRLEHTWIDKGFPHPGWIGRFCQLPAHRCADGCQALKCRTRWTISNFLFKDTTALHIPHLACCLSTRLTGTCKINRIVKLKLRSKPFYPFFQSFFCLKHDSVVQCPFQ